MTNMKVAFAKAMSILVKLTYTVQYDQYEGCFLSNNVHSGQTGQVFNYKACSQYDQYEGYL